MTVADTDVLIDFLTGTDPGAGAVMRLLEKGELRTTAITRFELLCGIRTTKEEEIVTVLLRALPTLPLDEAAAERAARVRRTLRDRGEEIGMGDSLIAGIVLEREAVLLTRNRRHFERVEGLQLVG